MFAVLYMFLIALYIIKREDDLWKQAALLVCTFNLLPYVSGDYRLIHLFLPLLLFVNSKERSRFDILYTILFGLLLIPKAYLVFKGIRSDSGFSDVSISVVINPLLMIILTLTILYEGMRKRSLE